VAGVAAGEDGVNRPGDAIEAAVLAAIGRPGAGWLATSRIAARIGRHQPEVDRALAALAQRGLVERGVDWAGPQVVAVWRFAGGSR
jgi:hypothetical protein